MNLQENGYWIAVHCTDRYAWVNGTSLALDLYVPHQLWTTVAMATNMQEEFWNYFVEHRYLSHQVYFLIIILNPRAGSKFAG